MSGSLLIKTSSNTPPISKAVRAQNLNESPILLALQARRNAATMPPPTTVADPVSPPPPVTGKRKIEKITPAESGLLSPLLSVEPDAKRVRLTDPDSPSPPSSGNTAGSEYLGFGTQSHGAFELRSSVSSNPTNQHSGPFETPMNDIPVATNHEMVTDNPVTEPEMNRDATAAEGDLETSVGDISTDQRADHEEHFIYTDDDNSDRSSSPEMEDFYTHNFEAEFQSQLGVEDTGNEAEHRGPTGGSGGTHAVEDNGATGDDEGRGVDEVEGDEIAGALMEEDDEYVDEEAAGEEAMNEEAGGPEMVSDEARGEEDDGDAVEDIHDAWDSEEEDGEKMADGSVGGDEELDLDVAENNAWGGEEANDDDSARDDEDSDSDTAGEDKDMESIDGVGGDEKDSEDEEETENIAEVEGDDGMEGHIWVDETEEDDRMGDDEMRSDEMGNDEMEAGEGVHGASDGEDVTSSEDDEAMEGDVWEDEEAEIEEVLYDDTRDGEGLDNGTAEDDEDMGDGEDSAEAEVEEAVDNDATDDEGSDSDAAEDDEDMEDVESAEEEKDTEGDTEVEDDVRMRGHAWMDEIAEEEEAEDGRMGDDEAEMGGTEDIDMEDVDTESDEYSNSEGVHNTQRSDHEVPVGLFFLSSFFLLIDLPSIQGQTSTAHWDDVSENSESEGGNGMQPSDHEMPVRPPLRNSFFLSPNHQYRNRHPVHTGMPALPNTAIQKGTAVCSSLTMKYPCAPSLLNFFSCHLTSIQEQASSTHRHAGVSENSDTEEEGYMQYSDHEIPVRLP